MLGPLFGTVKFKAPKTDEPEEHSTTTWHETWHETCDLHVTCSYTMFLDIYNIPCYKMVHVTEHVTI